MSGRSRVPEDLEGFKNYVDNTDNYLQTVIVPTHGTRLGLTLLNVSDWHTYRTKSDALYLLHDDETTDTKDVNNKLQALNKDFHKFANPIVDVIAVSPNRNVTDALIFNFVFTHADPTHATVQIMDECEPTADRLGGGDIEFECRVPKTVGKGKVAPGADSVRVAYTLGPDPLTDPDAAAKEKVYSGSSFILKLGAKAAGQNLNIYFQWYNTKHPQLAGPYVQFGPYVVI